MMDKDVEPVIEPNVKVRLSWCWMGMTSSRRIRGRSCDFSNDVAAGKISMSEIFQGS